MLTFLYTFSGLCIITILSYNNLLRYFFSVYFQCLLYHHNINCTTYIQQFYPCLLTLVCNKRVHDPVFIYRDQKRRSRKKKKERKQDNNEDEKALTGNGTDGSTLSFEKIGVSTAQALLLTTIEQPNSEVILLVEHSGIKQRYL